MDDLKLVGHIGGIGSNGGGPKVNSLQDSSARIGAPPPIVQPQDVRLM